MPHIICEYSRELSKYLNVTHMLHDMHQHLGKEPSVDLKRIKTRAVPVDDFVVGDGETYHHMMHITLKVMEGRDAEVRKRMAVDLQTIAKGYVQDCAVTAEVVELDKETYCA